MPFLRKPNRCGFERPAFIEISDEGGYLKTVKKTKKNRSLCEKKQLPERTNRPGSFVLLWIGVSRLFLLRLGYTDVVCEFEKSGKT